MMMMWTEGETAVDDYVNTGETAVDVDVNAGESRR